MKGYEVVARTLNGYGVTHVFFVPTILNQTLVEMEASSIARIVTHGEKAAAYMADGYARVSHRPGVCMAQMVGSANLAAGLRDARLASSPVLALTGGPWAHSRDRFQYQEVDDRLMFLPVTKASYRLDSVDRVGSTLRRAFRVALSGRPGPVHIEFAGHHGDVLETQDTDEPFLLEERFKSLPPYRPAADPDDVELAARSIANAEHPLIIAGGGVRQSDSAAALVEFANGFQIPVATSLTGKDVISAKHPLSVGVTGLYSRDAANEVASRADLVILVGTTAGSQVSHSWRVPDSRVPVIHIDLDPEVMGINYPNTTGLVGDIASVVSQLSEGLGDLPQKDRTGWLSITRSIVDEWYRQTAAVRESSSGPMRPERLCQELSNHLPDNAVVVSDTGHAGMWTAGWLDLTSNNQRLIRCAGSLGWGFPGGLGAQCAVPDRPVVVFTGDGGLWYHVAELETAARWNIPATIVVNNNHSLNQEINIWKDAYGGELRGRHEELWRFDQTDIAGVARAMGVPSVRVENPEEVGPALSKAVGSGGPFLIEVITDTFAIAPKAVIPAHNPPERNE